MSYVRNWAEKISDRLIRTSSYQDFGGEARSSPPKWRSLVQRRDCRRHRKRHATSPARGYLVYGHNRPSNTWRRLVVILERLLFRQDSRTSQKSMSTYLIARQAFFVRTRKEAFQSQLWWIEKHGQPTTIKKHETTCSSGTRMISFYESRRLCGVTNPSRYYEV